MKWSLYFMDKYLEETKLLNFSAICISDVIKKKDGWN